MATSVAQKTYCKSFIPLESNPDVFDELIHKLGVSQSLGFQDVYSLDDADLIALIPRPALALVLVFPTTAAYESRIAEEEAQVDGYRGCGDDEPVMFFEQTINNACGLYALLHAACNGEARKYIARDSLLYRLLHDGTSLKPKERALLLETSAELESAYASVASKGATQAPDNAEDEVDFHYICFVKSHINGHLFLMDGDRKQPIDLGPMAPGDDVCSEACLDVIRKMTREDSQHVGFSLMALVTE